MVNIQQRSCHLFQHIFLFNFSVPQTNPDIWASLCRLKRLSAGMSCFHGADLKPGHVSRTVPNILLNRGVMHSPGFLQEVWTQWHFRSADASSPPVRSHVIRIGNYLSALPALTLNSSGIKYATPLGGKKPKQKRTQKYASWLRFNATTLSHRCWWIFRKVMTFLLYTTGWFHGFNERKKTFWVFDWWE